MANSFCQTILLAIARYTAKDVNPIDQAQELTNYFYLGTNQSHYADVAADHALSLPVWQAQASTGGGACASMLQHPAVALGTPWGPGRTAHEELRRSL